MPRPSFISEEQFTQLLKNMGKVEGDGLDHAGGTIFHTRHDTTQKGQDAPPPIHLEKVGGGVVGTRSATVPRNTHPVGAVVDTRGRVSTGKAGSNPAPSPYKSKWESAYAAKLDLEKAAGLVHAYYYEPFSLWLPGKVRYKPDFMVQYADQQQLEVVEIKGWSRNLRDGMTRLKIAAALFPCFTWRIVRMKRGGGFDGEYI